MYKAAMLDFEVNQKSNFDFQEWPWGRFFQHVHRKISLRNTNERTKTVYCKPDKYVKVYEIEFA